MLHHVSCTPNGGTRVVKTFQSRPTTAPGRAFRELFGRDAEGLLLSNLGWFTNHVAVIGYLQEGRQ
jgi:hypothetical protein